MRLEEINDLRLLDLDELVQKAASLGISLRDLREDRPVAFIDCGPYVTKEMLRLAIIDKVIEGELDPD